MTLREKLMEAAEQMRQMDFRVFVSNDPENAFGFYSDERHVAYFQASEFGNGFNTAIVCRTPGSHGRHLMVEKDAVAVPLEKLTKDYLKKAFADYPWWFTREDKDRMPHIKHLDIDDFLKENEDKLSEVW